MTRLRVAGKEKMQMSGLTCACLGAADMRGLCPHMKYPRLRRGIFIMRHSLPLQATCDHHNNAKQNRKVPCGFQAYAL